MNSTLPKTHKTSFADQLKGKVAALAIKFVGVLPFSVGQTLGFSLGKLMLLLNTREVKIARRNLKLCFPEYTSEEKQSLLAQSFRHGGMQLFEIAYLWRNSPDKAIRLINEIEGEEVLQKAREKQQGILLILPHLGNWELVNAYMLQQMPMVAMYSPARLPAIEKLMTEGREKTGLKLAEANAKGVVRLIKTLKEGGNLTILPDQEPTRSGGDFAPFFHTEALTMTLISKMLHKSHATPIIAFVHRKGIGKGFKLFIKEVDPNIAAIDMRLSLSALNQSVETCISQFPEQYMWGYKRFRKRPEGESSLYKDLM